MILVLHISGSSAWGGNEQQLLDIIPALEKSKVRNVIFGLKNSPLHKKCEKYNIRFICAEEEKFNNFKNYKFLKQIVRAKKPDIIHLHTSNAVTVYVISDLIYKLKTRTVFSKKGMGNSMTMLSLYKYNYKNIDAIFCVSDAVKLSMQKHVLREKNYRKLMVLYEGININRLKKGNSPSVSFDIAKKSDKFIIGNIANHSEAKDLKTLIKSIEYLVNELKFKNFHLYQIGGYSQLTKEYEALIKELKLSSFISLTGFVDNATSNFNEFDIYVMSSEREGLPLTIYESFYKKIPVVSTRAGGIPEIIKDGDNGFLADIKDYKMLAIKIKKLLESKELRDKFAEESFDLFMNNFEVNKTALKMIRAYKSILKNES